MADVCRVPFGELSGDRLQKLSNVKNRQNGIVAAAAANVKATSSPVQKRSYDTSMLEFDSENIDPVSLKSKKSKCEPILFSSSITPFRSHPARQPQSDRPISTRSSLSKTPAGRSPKKHSRSLFARSFKRIDPPFASAPSALPFSLDAALNNTVSNAPIQSSMPKARAPMPSKWQFAIYEDSPEEEAATVMEHSTLTLDLSSDDEASVAKKSDRGKENTPPEGYIHSISTARLQSQGDEMHDTADTKADRSPLADLPGSEVPLLLEVSSESTTEIASKEITSQEQPEVDNEVLEVPLPASPVLEPVEPQAEALTEATNTFPSLIAPSTSSQHQDVQPAADDIVIFEDDTAG